MPFTEFTVTLGVSFGCLGGIHFSETIAHIRDHVYKGEDTGNRK
jgi:hypothetical protein